MVVSINDIYVPSEEVVAREIEGEFILVPLASGMGDMEDELYTLNETGKAIWNKFDGKKTLKQVGEELAQEFEASKEDIEKDIVGIVEELSKRRMLVKKSDG